MGLSSFQWRHCTHANIVSTVTDTFFLIFVELFVKRFYVFSAKSDARKFHKLLFFYQFAYKQAHSRRKHS